MNDLFSGVAGHLRRNLCYHLHFISTKVASSDWVFIALHPPVLMDTLQAIRNSVKKDALVVSFAPKITLDKIQLVLPDVTNEAISAMLAGTTETLFYSGLNYDEVIDLVPVKPLSEHENTVKDFYKTCLNGIYQKIKP